MAEVPAYAARLQRALRHGPRPMSVRQLGDIMREQHPEMRGASYSGMRSYSAGEVEHPRHELLAAIAGALGVRPEWLIRGDGPMTVAEVSLTPDSLTHAQGVEAPAASLTATTIAVPPATTEETDRQELAAMLEEWPDLTRGSAHTRASLMRLLNAFQVYHQGSYWDGRRPELARRLARALRGPLDALDLQRADLFGRSELTYLLSMSTAVLALIDDDARKRADGGEDDA
jgi:hypothetical protein